jgi:Tol biopolymer transport system component
VLPTASLAQPTIERISVAIGGLPDAPSFNARTSGDGSLVVFLSAASNLVPNDINGHADIFVFDRSSGSTQRVSLSFLDADPNDNSFPGVLSNDGRFVAFGSAASNLVRGDFNTVPDIYLFDRATQTTIVMSLSQEGQGGGAVVDLPPAISGDGLFVAFASQADSLVDNDDNEASDVFVFDRSTEAVEVMTYTSLGSPDTRTANGTTAGPAISHDGCIVAFYSDAANLVPQDTNSVRDVFVRNRCSGDIERVSVSSSGTEANGPSEAGGGAPGMSADGRFVVFFSTAQNLDPADATGTTNIYIRDRSDGTTRLVSRTSSGEAANGPSQTPSVSADGRFVVFQSLASNLVEGDSNGHVDVFVANVETGEIRLVSLTASGDPANGDSSNPQISSDGTRIVFQSSAQLTGDDTDSLVDTYSAQNPLSGEPPVQSPTPTETAGFEITPTPTATPPSTSTHTPPITPGGPTFTATVGPSFTATDVHGGGTVTPTRTTSTGGGTRTPTGSGNSGSGSGGGCSCRIDPAAGAAAADGPLAAMIAPALLWMLRRRRRSLPESRPA